MRRDHRPYALKRAQRRFEKFYVRHFLQPQFDCLGKGFAFMRPWYVRIFGAPVRLGAYATVIADADNTVRFSAWPAGPRQGRITVGRYSLICPGVRISSAAEIVIGHSCMLASRVYVTDSDWHGIYDRMGIGKAAGVHIADNVWLGDSAIVCKGVSIGCNSIIGAGAVVVQSVPANVVAAGNPARVVKRLDEHEAITAREQWFRDPAGLSHQLDGWDRALLAGNTWRHWLRHLFFPSVRD